MPCRTVESEKSKAVAFKTNASNKEYVDPQSHRHKVVFYVSECWVVCQS